MVTNELGQIAMIYYQPMPKVITFSVQAKKTKSGLVPQTKQYAFVVQHHISLAWVDPEYVEKVLNTKHYCCGGTANNSFKYASEAAVKVWQTGSY